MEDKINDRIIVALLLIGILVCFWMIGNAAYIAGGRKACENSDGMVLVEGFKCEPEKITFVETGLGFQFLVNVSEEEE